MELSSILRVGGFESVELSSTLGVLLTILAAVWPWDRGAVQINSPLQPPCGRGVSAPGKFVFHNGSRIDTAPRPRGCVAVTPGHKFARRRGPGEWRVSQSITNLHGAEAPFIPGRQSSEEPPGFLTICDGVTGL